MLGKELIEDFIKAGTTTHPCSIGSARERAVMNKLKNILPHGVGVGSGFVIDSYGNTSAQCDLIIYEEEYALKFVINDDDNYAYYNCESVIAVGEVKSDASISDIEDSFKKLKRIKELKRYYSSNRSFRAYLSKSSIYGAESEIYDEQNKGDDQIYTFVLCKTLKTPLSSIVSKAKEIFEEKNKYFNFIYPIENKPIAFLNAAKHRFAKCSMDADCICNVNISDSGFNFFITELINHIQNGRTVPLNTYRYIQNQEKFSVENVVPL